MRLLRYRIFLNTKLYICIKKHRKICQILLNIHKIGVIIENRVIISKGEVYYEIVRKIISKVIDNLASVIKGKADNATSTKDDQTERGIWMYLIVAALLADGMVSFVPVLRKNLKYKRR